MPSYVGWHEARNEDTPIDPRAVLEWLAAQPLDAHPGHCFQWSNANALVAGLLVEPIGEAPLSDQLERALFEPLGLEDSGFDGVDIPIRRAVHACYEVAGQVESDCHAFLPFRAEGLFTTAPDLVRLARGMAGRKIVDEGSKPRFMTEQTARESVDFMFAEAASRRTST